MVSRKNINKLGISILMMFLLLSFSSLAFADSGEFYVDNGVNPSVETGEIVTCGEENGSTFMKVIPYYVGVDEYGKLRVSVIDPIGEYLSTADGQLQITFDNSVWYNMTYNSTDKEWFAWLTSSVEEDVNITYKFSSSIYNCINETQTIKFRNPFYVDIELFETPRNTSNREPSAYTNDFHYVYFKLINETTGNGVPSNADVNRFFRNIYSWMPGIDMLYPDDEFDYDVVFWGKYTDGTARLKIYEAGTYDINLLTFNLDNGAIWPYEFIKPQYSEIKLDSNVGRYNLTLESDHTVKVLADRWEFDKVGVVVNIVKTMVTVVIVIIALGLVTFLPGGTKLIGAVVPILILAVLKYMGIL